MIVDDDVDIRSSLRTLLEDEGFPVVVAENGREALDLLTRGARPGLVLLDLMMPVMSGWDLLDAVRGRVELEALPFVVFTAAGLDLTTLRTITRPLVRKPIDPDLLLALVREMSQPWPDEPPTDLLPKLP